MDANVDIFSAFGSAANGGSIDEKMQKQLMEEEAAAMEKFRSGASASNPFAAAPAAGAEETPNILDLFGVAAPPAGAAPAAQPPAPGGATSDDLLQLSGNPFANMLNAAGAASNNSFPAPASNNMFPASSAPGKKLFHPLPMSWNYLLWSLTNKIFLLLPPWLLQVTMLALWTPSTSHTPHLSTCILMLISLLKQIDKLIGIINVFFHQSLVMFATQSSISNF